MRNSQTQVLHPVLRVAHQIAKQSADSFKLDLLELGSVLGAKVLF